MANITTEQYLAVSALAYSDLSRFIRKNLNQVIAEADKNEEIIEGYKNEKTSSISPEFHALSSLSDWVIVNAETYSSGMSAIALQNPDTKEVVFAFRGTELNDLTTLEISLPTNSYSLASLTPSPLSSIMPNNSSITSLPPNQTSLTIHSPAILWAVH